MLTANQLYKNTLSKNMSFLLQPNNFTETNKGDKFYSSAALNNKKSTIDYP